jgi:2-polyprenyl-3-methyl-5-hydroxy-6-metoxy-1,4-benzoquinol methylase
MKSPSPLPQYEYAYQNSQLGHHHDYLIQPLTHLLHKAATPTSNNQPQILDIGCGNGSLSHWIAQQGYDVTGVEESPSGVEQARQNFPQCQFISSSVYDLPSELLNNQFDIVISAEVIEHLFYPKELVKAAKKSLKPGGRLILTTPYHGYLKNLTLATSGKLDQHFTTLWDGGHIKFFSPKTLSALLIQEGYTDIQFKFAGRLPYLWKSMLCSSTLIAN